MSDLHGEGEGLALRGCNLVVAIVLGLVVAGVMVCCGGGLLSMKGCADAVSDFGDAVNAPSPPRPPETEAQRTVREREEARSWREHAAEMRRRGLEPLAPPDHVKRDEDEALRILEDFQTERRNAGK